MLEEEWRPVTGYEKYYLVSNKGRVKSLHGKDKNKLMAQQLRSGYPSVVLSRTGEKWKHKRVHRLVAEAFVANPLNKSWVDHVDEDRLNACADNLRWVWPNENALYSKHCKLWREVISVVVGASTGSEMFRLLTEHFKVSNVKLSQKSSQPRKPVKRLRKSVTSKGQ
jgi:hypothetical protein